MLSGGIGLALLLCLVEWIGKRIKIDNQNVSNTGVFQLAELLHVNFAISWYYLILGGGGGVTLLHTHTHTHPFVQNHAPSLMLRE